MSPPPNFSHESSYEIGVIFILLFIKYKHKLFSFLVTVLKENITVSQMNIWMQLNQGFVHYCKGHKIEEIIYNFCPEKLPSVMFDKIESF